MQSKFLAVGCVVPWAEPYVGALATQSWANPQYGPEGLALLREGLAAEEAVLRLTEADENRAQRQLGIVDREGRAASYTGAECNDWAGHRTGDGYAAQGNIRSRSASSTASTRLRRREATVEASSPRRSSSSGRSRDTRVSRMSSSTSGWTTTSARSTSSAGCS